MKVFQNGLLLLITILILASAADGPAESLSSPGFSGYLTGKNALQAGDIVLVRIDASSALSFEASSRDAGSLTLEFSGGEFGNLFSFLPAAKTGGELSARGNQAYQLKTDMAARVAEIDPTGKARLEGTRTFSVGGKEELVSIGGWIDPRALGPDKRLGFSELADARLTFRTFLQPSGAALTAADIERVIQAVTSTAPAGSPAAALPAQPAAAGGGGAPGVTAAGGAQPAGSPAPGYQLTEQKKIELFLSYINRLVELLFR